jgi:hypothetical protein
LVQDSPERKIAHLIVALPSFTKIKPRYEIAWIYIYPIEFGEEKIFLRTAFKTLDLLTYVCI